MVIALVACQGGATTAEPAETGAVAPLDASSHLAAPQLHGQAVSAGGSAAVNIPPLPDLTVEGEFELVGRSLVARRIVFTPNAKLVIVPDRFDSSTPVLISAEEIIVEDASRPGSITWLRPALVAPPALGPAAAGADNGAIVGLPGGDGAPGVAGTAGQVGFFAPMVVLYGPIIQGPLIVDLGGQEGGPGGAGQAGGRGGAGGPGVAGVHSNGACVQPPGPGARGGNGGPGGKGGASGNGGRGGMLVVATRGDPAVARRLLRVDVSGGKPGGAPGAGGTGGVAGVGGKAVAPAEPGCATEARDGEAGLAGPDGAPGAMGIAGADGRVEIFGL